MIKSTPFDSGIVNFTLSLKETEGYAV
jgi:hypothetical protein